MDLADPISRALTVLITITVVSMIFLIMTEARLAKAVGQILLFLGITWGVGLFIFVISSITPAAKSTWSEWSESVSKLLTDIMPSVTNFFLIAGIVIFSLFIFLTIMYVIPLINKRILAYVQAKYLVKFIAMAESEIKDKIIVEDLSTILDSLSRRLKLQIIGRHGGGKTTLLWQIGHYLASMSSEAKYLPIYIDLDNESNETLRLENRNIRTFLKARGFSLWENWLFAKTYQQKPGEIVFIVDSSFSTSNSKTINHNKDTYINLVTDLASQFRDCSFIIATHSSSPSFSTNKYALAELEEDEINKYIRFWARYNLPVFSPAQLIQELQKQTKWLELADRPFYLLLLTKFFIKNKVLPNDIRNLFSEIVYPGKNYLIVEETGCKLAYELLKKGYSLHTSELNTDIDIRKTKLPGVFKTTNNEEPTVGFTHPLFFEYFIALSISLNRFSPAELDIAFQSFLDNDPFWLDVFNLLTCFDDKTNKLIINMLINRDFNVSSDLSNIKNLTLKLPFPDLPDKFLKLLSPSIFRDFSQPKASPRAWKFFESLPDNNRIVIVSNAVTALKSVDYEKSLFWLYEYHKSELVLSLWNGSDEVSNIVGEYLTRQVKSKNTTEAVRLLVQLFHEGPYNKKIIALNIMGGHFKKSDISDTLYDLLRETDNPGLKISILQNLIRSGTDSILTLIDIARNTREDESVRNTAIELLCESKSPELYSVQVIQSVLILNQEKSTDETHLRIEGLLSRLQERESDLVNELQKRLNPYIAGKPVSGRLFIGRAKILHKLRSIIESGSNVIISGERRIGKTSILLQLRDEFVSDAQKGLNIKPVFINLEKLKKEGKTPGSEEDIDLYSLIIDSINNEIHALQSSISTPTYDYWQFLRDLIICISTIQTKIGTKAKLVLLIDEADILYGYSDAQLARLRGAFMDYRIKDNLVLLLAGVGTFLEKWSHPTSPFFNTFHPEPIIISAFTNDEAVELITKPIGGTITYDPAAIELIIAFSKNRPYIIQSLCHKVVTEILEHGERHVSVDAVKGAYSRLEDKRSKIMNDLISSYEDLIKLFEDGGISREIVEIRIEPITEKFLGSLNRLSTNDEKG